MSKRPFQIVVCGSVFGQIYQNALAKSGQDIALAGILARGSDRSVACARELGVPLYKAPEDIPPEVDAVCVVIRGHLLGGPGSALARACLEKGFHVLQEHPLHRDELAETLRVARRVGRSFMLNSFYTHLPEVRRTLAVFRAVRERRQLRWVDAMTSYQVAFALIDVLADAFDGLRGWALDPMQQVALPGWPWQGVTGTISGVPLAIRIQMEMNPAEPDGGNALLHRLSFGFEGGMLTQTDVHGPLVWTAEPAFPASTRQSDSSPYFSGIEAHKGAPASVTIAGGAETSYGSLFGSSWSEGVHHAVNRLRQITQDPEAQRRHAQRMLSVCRLWANLSALVGLPKPPACGPGAPLNATEIAAIKAATDAWSREK
jgi:pyochelin biosynthetic protein PchG